MKRNFNEWLSKFRDSIAVTIQSPKNSTMLKVKKEEKKIVKLPIDKKERMC